MFDRTELHDIFSSGFVSSKKLILLGLRTVFLKYNQTINTSILSLISVFLIKLLKFRILSVAINATLVTLIAREYGLNHLGYYYLTVSIVLIAGNVISLGVNKSIVNIVNRRLVDTSRPRVMHLYAKCCLLLSLSSVLLWSLTTVTLFVIHRGLPPPNELYVWAAIYFAPIYALNLLNCGSFFALKKTVSGTLFFSTIPNFLSLVIFSYFILNEINLSGIWQIYLATIIVNTILSTSFWINPLSRLNLPSPMPSGAGISPNVTEIAKFSSKFWIISFSSLLLLQLDTLMLGWISTKDEVGLYSLAYRISALCGLGILAVNSIFPPKIAAAFKANDLRIEQICRNTTTLLVLTTIPAVFLVLVAGEYAFALIFSNLVISTNVLSLLLVGLIFNVFCGPVMQVLQMSGEEKTASLWAVLVIVINFSLNLLLIPKFGSIGAAWASVCSIIVLNVALSIIVYRRHGIIFFFGASYLERLCYGHR